MRDRARIAGICASPLLAAMLALATASPAQAKVGAVDEVPAASLLLPYFEVDLADPNGPQTRFTITNLVADPQLAHVQLWSDYAVPTFGFDVYLGGYDSIEVDLRLAFQGLLPRSGPGISGQGPFSEADVNFPGCGSPSNVVQAVSLPVPDLLSAEQRTYMQRAHTGQPVAEAGGRCTGHPHGDSVARGYVTVDVVSQCSLLTPRSPGYFIDGGAGVATNANVLSGSFTLMDRGEGQYAVSPLVHIEADAADPLTTTPGDQTFYGRHVNGTAADNREPLGTVWQARALLSGVFDAGTDVIAWRDSGTPGSLPQCGNYPSPFPLQHTQMVAFDEEENIHILGAEVTYPNPPPPPYLGVALATQRVDAAEITPFDFGFLQLNLNAVVAGTPYAVPDVMQSMVLVRHARGGAHAAAVPAMRLVGPQYQPSATSCDWENHPAVCVHPALLF